MLVVTIMQYFVSITGIYSETWEIIMWWILSTIGKPYENNLLVVSITICNFYSRYLQRNSSTLFNLGDYYVVDPEYHRKAM